MGRTFGTLRGGKWQELISSEESTISSQLVPNRTGFELLVLLPGSNQISGRLHGFGRAGIDAELEGGAERGQRASRTGSKSFFFAAFVLKAKGIDVPVVPIFFSSQ